MPPVLLLLPSDTYRATAFSAAAVGLGLDVVVATDHAQTLSQVAALVIDFDHTDDAVATIVEHQPFAAIVAADDRGVVIAAAASEKLGLPHNSVAAASATRDKVAMRVALHDAGVAQPRFRIAWPGADVVGIAAEVGFPCVVKPISLSGSRGVIRVDVAAKVAAVADRIRVIAGRPDGALLIEEYVDGDEVAVEATLDDGLLTVLAVFDKPDPLVGPYFEETIYVTPSRHPIATQALIKAAVGHAVAAIGLRHGPIHAELRLGPEGVMVIEVAARPIGGLCSRALHFGLMGASLEEIILRSAVGRPLRSLRGDTSASGVMMIPIPAAGRLVEVGGQDAAQAVAGITGLEITVAKGRRVEPLPEGDRYLGFLFAKAATPDLVEQALRTANAHLKVHID